jgi:hypothetical protein
MSMQGEYRRTQVGRAAIRSLTAGLVLSLALPLEAQPGRDLRPHPAGGRGSAPDRNHADKPSEGKDGMQEMMLVDRFLRLPPERISHMRQTLERLEKMTADEKESLRQRIQQYKSLHPREQSQLHRNWERVSSEHRERMRQRWREMSEKERRLEREKVQKMSAEERRDYYGDKLEATGAPRPPDRPRYLDRADAEAQDRKAEEPEVIIIEGTDVDEPDEPDSVESDSP